MKASGLHRFSHVITLTHTIAYAYPISLLYKIGKFISACLRVEFCVVLVNKVAKAAYVAEAVLLGKCRYVTKDFLLECFIFLFDNYFSEESKVVDVVTRRREVDEIFHLP